MNTLANLVRESWSLVADHLPPIWGVEAVVLD